MKQTHEIKPVAKGVAVCITRTESYNGKVHSRREVIPCPAEYSKALILAATGGLNVELPYTWGEGLIYCEGEFPPEMWWRSLTSDNSPAEVVFDGKKKLADLLERESVNFWKWEPEKAERIRAHFKVSGEYKKPNVTPDVEAELDEE